jgi:uncharacterized protein
VKRSRLLPRGTSPGRILQGALLRLRGGELGPRRLALSVATGVFIAMLPIPGFQTFVWLGLVAIFPIDPILTYACTWVSNPLTLAPLTFLELEIGSLIFTRHWLDISQAQLVTLHGALKLGSHLMIGGLAFALGCAVVTYQLAHILALWIAKVSAPPSLHS